MTLQASITKTEQWTFCQICFTFFGTEIFESKLLTLRHVPSNHFRIHLSNEVKWKSLSRVWFFVTPWTIYYSWNSPGQNTGVGSLSLLQGIVPTQGSNPGLLHYRQILYQLSYQGSPRILEWVAYPFSSGSSRPRNRTGVSCIAGGFFTNWAIREACISQKLTQFSIWTCKPFSYWKKQFPLII